MQFHVVILLFLFLTCSGSILYLPPVKTPATVTTTPNPIESVDKYVALLLGAFEFSKTVAEQTERQRRWKRQLGSLKYCENPNVTSLVDKMSHEVESAGRSYGAMIEYLRNMSLANLDARDSYRDLGAWFDETDFQTEVELRFAMVTTMMDMVVKRTSDVMGQIGVIETGMASVSGRIARLRETLDQMAKEGMEAEVAVQKKFWKCSVPENPGNLEWENEVEVLNRIVDDWKAYVEWLEQSGAQLKVASKKIGKKMGELRGVAGAQKNLVTVLSTLPKGNQGKKDYVMAEIGRAVEIIGEFGCEFLRTASDKSGDEVVVKERCDKKNGPLVVVKMESSCEAAEMKYKECPVTNPKVRRLRDDYHYTKGIGSYKIYHQNPKNWSEARKACIEDGGHLAIVDSQDEKELLAKMVDGARTEMPKNITMNNGAWIGTHYVNEGWNTVCGDFVTPDHWSTTYDKQPEPDRSKNCAYITMFSLKGYGMVSFYCDHKLSYICEL